VNPGSVRVRRHERVSVVRHQQHHADAGPDVRQQMVQHLPRRAVHLTRVLDDEQQRRIGLDRGPGGGRLDERDEGPFLSQAGGAGVETRAAGRRLRIAEQIEQTGARVEERLARRLVRQVLDELRQTPARILLLDGPGPPSAPRSSPARAGRWARAGSENSRGARPAQDQRRATPSSERMSLFEALDQPRLPVTVRRLECRPPRGAPPRGRPPPPGAPRAAAMLCLSRATKWSSTPRRATAAHARDRSACPSAALTGRRAFDVPPPTGEKVLTPSGASSMAHGPPRVGSMRATGTGGTGWCRRAGATIPIAGQRVPVPPLDAGRRARRAPPARPPASGAARPGTAPDP
jgi:hypothetical protein